MKNLTKLIIVVIAFTMTTGLFAQDFAVKAGLNLSNMLMKEDGDTYSDDFKMRTGFHVGATVEFPINELFSFETGLLLSTKGFKVSEEETYDGETYEYDEKLNLLYFDIPLTAKVSFDAGGVKIYGLFGPYLGMGLTGKYKWEETYAGDTESDEESVEWGSDADEDHLKRFDFGLTMGAGVEISSIQIGLTYGLGLANISSADDEEQVNNRVLGISFGYKFSGK
jgi:hypothetical protein